MREIHCKTCRLVLTWLSISLKCGLEQKSLQAMQLLEARSIMRGAEIDRRTLRDYTSRINRRVAGVVVPLDLIEVDGLGDAGHLVQLAQIVP